MDERVRQCFALALATYMLALPVVAEAASASPPTHQDYLGVPFESLGGPIQRFEAPNGFEMTTVQGVYSVGDHSHSGGVMTITSPSGEQLAMRTWRVPDGMMVSFGDTHLYVQQDVLGPPTQIAVRSAAGDVEAVPLGATRLNLLMANDFSAQTPADVRLTAAFVNDLAAMHSEEFWQGIQDFGPQVMEASCIGLGALCAGAVLLLAASVGAVLTTCIVAGNVVLGTACVNAMLLYGGSWLTGFGACTIFADDCLSGDDHRDDEGCSGPGGGNE